MQQTLQEWQDTARKAYTYGYPTVDLYRILHNFALDPSSPEFKAPLNAFGHARQLADPNDTSIVAMNVDTPYSYAWLDLRSEPVVVTLPSFEAKRYVSAEIFDLYTNIVGYVSPRTNGNTGGSFLMAGPGWDGAAPAGITGVFHFPTQLGLILLRTQLFDTEDMANVRALQDRCAITPLSRSPFATGASPQVAPPLAPIAPIDVRAGFAPAFFDVLNWMLQYMPGLEDETQLRTLMATIGIAPGVRFVPAHQAQVDAVVAGMQAAMDEIYARCRTVKASAELFGSREFYNGDYLIRACAAFLGILGNAAEEYLGVGYMADGDGQPFTGEHAYKITFVADKLPPVDAFWSITVYDDKKLLYPNEIDRHLVNTPLIPKLTKNADGGFTIYVQHQRPAVDQAANWLPCPAGPFGLTFRTYLPQAPIRTGAWTAPPVVRA